MATESFQNFHDLEKDFFSKIRNGVKSTEDLSDLRRFFSATVSELLDNACGDDFDIDNEDVAFAPESEGYYKLSPRLRGSAAFLDTWRNSSLPHVVRKAADTTYHRYIHLSKHLEKTEKKIRN